MKMTLFAFTTLVFGSLSLASSVPVQAERKTLNRVIVLSGPVEPLESDVIKVKWFTPLRKFHITECMEVRKGDLLAEAELKFFESRRSYLKSRFRLLSEKVKQANWGEAFATDQLSRARALVKQGIAAVSQSDTAEIKLLDAKLARMRLEREFKELNRDKEKVENQIHSSNFFASRDGVVSQVLVNPKQVVGSINAFADSILARIDKPGSYLVKALALDVQAMELVKGKTGRLFFDGNETSYPCEIINIGRSNTLQKEGVYLYEIQITFEKKAQSLSRGILARVEFPVIEDPEVISIPWNAVRTSKNEASILVYSKDKVWRDIPVALGLRNRHRVEVKNGLNAGDFVEAELW